MLMIPEVDAAFLNEKQYSYELNEENGVILVVIHSYLMPAHYSPSIVDLLILLPAGYPNAKPDMFWTTPDVKLQSGVWPKASDVHENKLGKSWQRWSRHFPNDQWRAGVDNLRSYLAAIRTELHKGI